MTPRYCRKKRKEIDDNSPVEDEALLNIIDVIGVDNDGGEGMGLSQVSGMTISPACIGDTAAATFVCHHTPGTVGVKERPCKKSKSNNDTQHKKHPLISDNVL